MRSRFVEVNRDDRDNTFDIDACNLLCNYVVCATEFVSVFRND